MSNNAFTILIVSVVILFCFISIAVNNNRFRGTPPNDSGSQTANSRPSSPPNEHERRNHSSRPDRRLDLQKSILGSSPNREIRGGIPRPKSDMVDGTYKNAPKYFNPTERYGQTPLLAKETNDSTRRVYQSLKSRAENAPVSSFVKPENFDRDAYLKDPEKYLEQVHPGRIWQTASSTKPDGANSKEAPSNPIKRRGDYFQSMLQGETITLQAETDPGMPVTFYSPRLGAFNNLLSVITVMANESGVAEAQFTATKGQFGEIDLIATSPVRTHQARFLVEIGVPEPPPKLSPSQRLKR